jgi:hypothetical protein
VTYTVLKISDNIGRKDIGECGTNRDQVKRKKKGPPAAAYSFKKTDLLRKAGLPTRSFAVTFFSFQKSTLVKTFAE